MDCSPPGSSVYGILQARILQWVAMPSSRASSQLRGRTHVSYISRITDGFFTTSATRKALKPIELSSQESLSIQDLEIKPMLPRPPLS